MLKQRRFKRERDFIVGEDEETKKRDEPILLENLLLARQKDATVSYLMKLPYQSLKSFEQTATYAKLFVQKQALWEKFFERDFPVQYANNKGMKEETREWLDGMSVRPGNPLTYWKRFYELLAQAKFLFDEWQKEPDPFTLPLESYTMYSIEDYIDYDRYEFMVHPSTDPSVFFYVVGEDRMIANGVDEVPFDASKFAPEPLIGSSTAFSADGGFLMKKDTYAQSVNIYKVAPYREKFFLVSCSACDKELASGYHQFDGHEEHKFCSEDCANEWWESK